jgi:carboxymethylenebutenolidase
MIVIQEWWGLNDNIKDIAQRYADEGYLALAPDMYHGRVTDKPEEARQLAMGLDHGQAAKEVDAAVRWLKTEQGTAYVGCVGYCMGGRIALAAALRRTSGIQAAHVYYGGGMPDDADLSGPRVPVMGSYGSDEADRAESVEAGLAAANIEHNVKVYEGAHHGFFNATGQAYHAEAAADSWERSKAWFARHLAPRGPGG